MTADWQASWVDALGALELDANRMEQLINQGRMPEATAWIPPVLGPIPMNLVERAHHILDRHTEVAARLAHAARETRQHLALLDRIEDDGRTRIPVFVDQVF